jgi:hypothetical protein
MNALATYSIATLIILFVALITTICLARLDGCIYSNSKGPKLAVTGVICGVLVILVFAVVGMQTLLV